MKTAEPPKKAAAAKVNEPFFGKEAAQEFFAPTVDQSFFPAPTVIQRIPDDVAKKREEDAKKWEEDSKKFKKLKKHSDAAYALRVFILLHMKDTGGLHDMNDYDSFYEDCLEIATDETRTLNEGPADFKKVTLYTNVDAFPHTWSDMVYKALYLDFDLNVLNTLTAEAWKNVENVGNKVPAALMDTGLPVEYSKALQLTAFDLGISVLASGANNIVVDFARAGRDFITRKWALGFYTLWNGIAASVRDAIADGTMEIAPTDYDDFMENRRKGITELSNFISTATDEITIKKVNQDAMDLRRLALLAGFGSILGGLAVALTFWNSVRELFRKKLQESDDLVKGKDTYDRIALALKWAYENGYFGSAGAQLWESIKENWTTMLRDLAIFVVLQFIPVVDVAVDVIVMLQSGVGAIKSLIAITKAFHEVSKADSTVSMQRQAARLAQSITTDGVMLIIDLVGFISGIKGVKARAGQLKAANPALSEAEALKEATSEAKMDPKLTNTVKSSIAIEESTEITQRLGNMTPETVEALAKNPALKTALFENKIAAFLLKKCASPCFPPGATAEQVQRLQKIMERAEAIQSKMEPKKLREFLYSKRSDLDDALGQLEEHVQHLEKAHMDKVSGIRTDEPEPDMRFENPTGTKAARGTGGTPTGELDLPELGSDWLDRGISQIPGQIAKKIRNIYFNSFDEFRQTFWRMVAQDPELRSSPFLTARQNPTIIGRGGAPFTRSRDAIGKGVNAKYQLDHITPLHIGGETYNLDDLYIVTPKIHEAVGH